jgi:acetyltransferase-like isoleucine patch superfamily enzyme
MENNHSSVNEKELMDYYHYSGSSGRLKLRLRFLRTWILHSIAYSNPLPGMIIQMQRTRGVKIGKNCHFSPYVQIDLLYPHLITIGDDVAIGSNVMIFAHSNPTTNLYLKSHGYAREVNPVHIKSGAIIGPGSIITAGVTIGENSIVGVGSVVSQDVPDYCVVLGNPARIIKKIDH